MSIQKVDLALTAAGKALKAKIEAGSGTVALEITRIVTASGTSDDPLNLTDVVNRKQEFTITERSTKDARTTIKAVLTNIELSEGYSLSQIGFFALDPDEGEILYRISQFDAPNYVPASTERGWTYEPSFNFITGNAKDVIVNIDPAGLASIGRLAEEIAKHNTDPNAHANLFSRKVVTTRMRDAAKPDYGAAGGGGEWDGNIEVSSYTGNAEVTVVTNGVEYDGDNISSDGANAPDNTIIITEVN